MNTLLTAQLQRRRAPAKIIERGLMDRPERRFGRIRGVCHETNPAEQRMWPKKLMRPVSAIIAALVVAAVGPDIQAQEGAAYEQRNIARYVEMFAWLDVDRNEEVTRHEAQGNVEFTAVFEDIDINRDGVVTRAELERFLTQRFAYAPRK